MRQRMASNVANGVTDTIWGHISSNRSDSSSLDSDSSNNSSSDGNANTSVDT